MNWANVDLDMLSCDEEPLMDTEEHFSVAVMKLLSLSYIKPRVPLFIPGLIVLWFREAVKKEDNAWVDQQQTLHDQREAERERDCVSVAQEEVMHHTKVLHWSSASGSCRKLFNENVWAAKNKLAENRPGTSP